MNAVLKLRKVGNSTGMTLPAEMLGRKHLREGDQVIAVEVEDGILIKRHDPDFLAELEAMEDSLHQFDEALAELAKR